jgi:hypothetical protein
MTGLLGGDVGRAAQVCRQCSCFGLPAGLISGLTALRTAARGSLIASGGAVELCVAQAIGSQIDPAPQGMQRLPVRVARLHQRVGRARQDRPRVWQVIGIGVGHQLLRYGVLRTNMCKDAVILSFLLSMPLMAQSTCTGVDFLNANTVNLKPCATSHINVVRQNVVSYTAF